MRLVAREVARAERAREQARRRSDAAHIRSVKSADRQAKADAKEEARHYAAGRLEEAEDQTRDVLQREVEIETLLARALNHSPAVSLTADLETFIPAKFDETPWTSVQPELENFLPKDPGFLARMLPGADTRNQRRIDEGRRAFEAADAAHREGRAARASAYRSFLFNEDARAAAVHKNNEEVRDFERRLRGAEHAQVIQYYQAVLDGSLTDEADAVSAEIGYSPDSRHLVVDLELPEISVIPEESGFRYVKSADRIDAIGRPAVKRKALYASLVSQATLKAVDTIYRGGPSGVVSILTINGMLDTIDPSTGQNIRVCLVSVRVTEDGFRSLNLRQVQPDQCLRSLRASVSRSPAELLPVKPLVELDMVDPRFVDTVDVMSSLDARPNLMELSPNEFEGLITNLFSSMGLDTRQTRPSRDGGVDTVAFDTRPVFGGKVVIQAKRYKNTVGVSAVRDLFGTVQNEGASKGILVTTSGYGKAAFDFAKGKPLELLDGGNLLHLLAEHAGIDARFIMPEDWKDAPVHGN